MKKFCIWLIEVYQKYLSPLKGKPTCRFYPTCSQYAKEAFQTHGVFWGFFLSLKRLLKCNPLFPGGYDPVPPKKVKK